MRLAVSLLTCITVSVLTPALADPPASAKPAAPAAATPAAAAAAATPGSTPSASDPAAVKPSVDVEAAKMEQAEKHFLAEGYKIEMHSGEKYFCRREEQLGSRLGGEKHCSTAQQLLFTEEDSQRQARDAVRQQATGPSGK